MGTVTLSAAQRAQVLAQAAPGARVLSAQTLGVAGTEIQVIVSGAHIGQEQIINIQPSGEAVRTGGFVSDAEARMGFEEAKKLPSQQTPLTHVQSSLIKGAVQRQQARPSFEGSATRTFRSQVAPSDIIPEEVVTMERKDTGQDITFTKYTFSDKISQRKDIIGDTFNTGRYFVQTPFKAAKGLDVEARKVTKYLPKEKIIASKSFSMLSGGTKKATPFEKGVTTEVYESAFEKPASTGLKVGAYYGAGQLTGTGIKFALTTFPKVAPAVGIGSKVLGGAFVISEGAQLATKTPEERGKFVISEGIKVGSFSAGLSSAKIPTKIKTKVRQPRPQEVRATAKQSVVLEKVKGRDIVAGKAKITIKSQTFQRLPKSKFTQVDKVGKAPIFRKTDLKPLSKVKTTTLQGRVQSFGLREAEGGQLFKQGKTFKQLGNKDISHFLNKYPQNELKLVKGSFQQVKVRGKGFTKGKIDIVGVTTNREGISIVPKTGTTARSVTKINFQATQQLDKSILKFQGKQKVVPTFTYAKPTTQNLLFQKPLSKFVSFKTIRTPKEAILFDRTIFQQSTTQIRAQPPGAIPRSTRITTTTQSVTKLPVSKTPLKLSSTTAPPPPNFGVKPATKVNVGGITLQTQAQIQAQASTTTQAIPGVTQVVVKSIIKTPATQFKTTAVKTTGKEGLVLLTQSKQKQQRAYAFALQPARKQKQQQALKPAVIQSSKQKQFQDQELKYSLVTKTLQSQQLNIKQQQKQRISFTPIAKTAITQIQIQPQKQKTIAITTPNIITPSIIPLSTTKPKPKPTEQKIPVGFRFNLKAGKGLSLSKGFKLPKQSYNYTPSVFAIGERIFGKRPRIITGAGIRPLPLSLKPIKKKKKRRKR